MNHAEDPQSESMAAPASAVNHTGIAPDDSRIIRALQEFQAAIRAGHTPNRSEFQARHPDIAEALAECLDGLEFVHVVAPHLTDPGLALSVAADTSPEGPLGDFRIVREIGRGGMGVVYEAVQISLGRRVALKVLPFVAAMDPKQLQRFKNEAQAAAHLQHQNIVPVHYVGCERGVHFYAMQYIEGQTLAALIHDLRQLAGVEPAGTGAFATGSDSLAADLVSGRWLPVQQSGGNAHGSSLLTKRVDETCNCFEAAWKAAAAARERPRIEDYLGALVGPERLVLLRELVLLDVYYRRLHREDPQPADYSKRFPELHLDALAGAVGPRSSTKSGSPTTAPALTNIPPLTAQSTKHSTTSPAFFRTVAHLAVQAAEALEHAHQLGVIHRDIKPANLLVDAGGRLWITDFGLAHYQSYPGLTMTGDLVGTLRYMSPERALGKRATLDARTDVFSLGATLYELLTLEPAYNGRNREEVLRQIAFEEPRQPSRVNQAVPADLQTIVLKAMAKSAEERYATAQELADDLRRFLAGEPIRARPASAWERGAKWARRRPAVAALMAVSVVAFLSILGGTLWHNVKLGAALKKADTILYHSLVNEIQAIRRARDDGYRTAAFNRLKRALKLDTPEKDLSELRQEAAACLGDFVGLQPTSWEESPVPMESAALHPDGTLLALGLADGTVQLRRIPDGALVRRLPGHSSYVANLAFRADGKELVSVDWTGKINVWANQEGTWTRKKTLVVERTIALLMPSLAFPLFTTTDTSWVSPSPVAYFASAALTSDGRYLAASWTNSTVALVDIVEGTTASQFPVPNGEQVWTLAVSPDGKLLAGAYSLQERGLGVLVWDVRTHALKKRLLPELEQVYGISFSPDSQFLVCTHAEGVALYDTSMFQLRSFGRGDLPRGIAFSPDSQILAYQAENYRSIRLWNVSMNQYIAALRCRGAFWAEFSKDGKMLVAVTRKLVRIWNLAGANEKLVLKGHGAAVSSVVFSPDGKLLATSGRDHKIKIWNPITGMLLQELTESSTPVEGLSFSHDGRVLAAGNYDNGMVRFYDVESWNVLTEMQLVVGGKVLSTAFSPKGQYFAAAGTNGLTLWRIVRGAGEQATKGRISLQPLGRLAEEFSASICFSPDGHWLAWVGGDWWGQELYKVHAWDLDSMRLHDLSMARSRFVMKALGFCSNSKQLVFVNDKLAITRWDVTTKQELPSFGELENRSVESPKTHLSADGTWYAVADQTVTIWDMAAKKLLVALSPERSSVCSVGWSPDRNLLAVGGTDGGLEIWNLPAINAKLAEIGLGW